MSESTASGTSNTERSRPRPRNTSTPSFSCRKSSVTLISRFGNLSGSTSGTLSCFRASCRCGQSSGQWTVTSRSVPQQIVQISPRTPGQKRFGFRISQIAHAISLSIVGDTYGPEQSLPQDRNRARRKGSAGQNRRGDLPQTAEVLWRAVGRALQLHGDGRVGAAE